MNRKSKRDPRRRPKHVDAAGNSKVCLYFVDPGGEVQRRSTTFVTPEMRAAKSGSTSTSPAAAGGINPKA